MAGDTVGDYILAASDASFELAVAADEVVGRAVMIESRLSRALELRNDALGKNFAELDAPLIERINLPDRALGEHAVLVERDEFPKRARGQAIEQDGIGRPVAFEEPM